MRPPPRPPVFESRFKPDFRAYVVRASDFNENNVGGKASNLSQLQGKLPDWIGLPRSVALPFGVFEAVLAEEANRRMAEHYEELVRHVDKGTERVNSQGLSELRKTIMDLMAPDTLISSFYKVMKKAGLPEEHARRLL